MPSDKQKFNLPEEEEKILKFWEENKIFEKSLEKTKRGKPFIFYEGPPTANAAPGIHHVEARAFKDIIPRYKTMLGFNVPRKAGWDTHGLPVEIQIEKELGFKSKQDIEEYGIAKFNSKAKESVWRHKEEWEKLTERMGFWIDMARPYITYDPLYMESLWWVIKQFWKKGFLKEDFKVVPWCPRCQTGLSTHELGQPGAYKLVKENSIFVKLKISAKGGSVSGGKNKDNEYLLIWTTTPWTLPANVAVAINPRIEYTKYKLKSDNYEYIWSAVAPPTEMGESVEVVERASGKSLLGIFYEPLFRVPKEYSLGAEPEYKTIPASFVSIEEGTGMVHLAPAFGDEDMNVVKSQTNDKSQTKISYPILHTVNFDGTMKEGIVGAGKFIKAADEDIIADLRKRGLLHKILSYEHDYPHCWRCDTLLLYFAKNSWWVKTTAVKEKLIANNEKVNWVPEHLKRGRFGEFLNELRDWSFSRERYWGTPLPIWKCSSCEKKIAIESRDELIKFSDKAKNNYFVMRHGESTSNIRDLAGMRHGAYHLTLRGRAQVEKTAKKIKNLKFDLIFASDILRTKETAEIIARLIGLNRVFFDNRIREVNIGVFEGGPTKAYHKYFSSRLEKFSKKPPKGENLSELRGRTFSFLNDLEKKYSGKNILLVSHEYTVWMLYSAAMGWSDQEAVDSRVGPRKDEFIKFAEIIPLPYKNLPRDSSGGINLHRPYVDTFLLNCPKCEGKMKRISEVSDVWFDSGAMPFAQAHHPFARAQIKNSNLKSKNFGKLLYPADYISEAVDQTRGWFYTLLAVATLLGKKAPYKNVVSLGHVLDKNGQKMSKSKGNVVNPWEMIQKYGVDTLRWYFYSINSPGEPKRFDEKDLENKLRGFLMTFWNSFLFFNTYVDKIPRCRQGYGGQGNSQNILDQWVLAKLNLLVGEVTKKLDKYDITSAARAIEEFTINDFSQWYLRRSRSRLQHPNYKKEKDEAAMTMAHVLLVLSKISAPFIPFLSEEIYQRLRQKSSLKYLSVHLTEWPKLETRDKRQETRILRNMREVREIVTEALKLRAEAGIKVRQPLQKLKIKNEELKYLGKELLELVKNETNVKEIIFDGNIKNEFELDIKITPELKEEGMIREIIRNIQEMRKDLGLRPKDTIKLQISSDSKTDAVMLKWKKLITFLAGVRIFTVGGKKVFKIEREVEFEGQAVWIGVS